MNRRIFLKSGGMALAGGATVLSMAGCTSTEVSKVVTIIEDYLPTAITDISSLLTLIADLSAKGLIWYKPVFKSATSTASTLTSVITVLQTKAADVETILTAYSAGTSVWADVVAAVDALYTESEATIDLSGISDATSKSKASTLLAAIDVAVDAIYTAVLTTESTSTVKAKLAANKRTLHARLVIMTPQEREKFVAQLKPVTGIGSMDGYEKAVR